jgi:ATP-dependent helicase/nuclease subunit B
MARPDERIDARLRGTAIHAALERFSVAWPTLDPATASQTFVDLYLAELRAGGMPEPALARETALAINAGAWACGFEANRRADGAAILIEQQGELTIDAPREPFRLTARADRLELHQGGLSVIDFKTGGAPSKKQVETGFSPQLSLTAAIAEQGGFPGLGRVRPDALLYVSVTGRRPPAKIEDRSGEAGAAAAAATALEGLRSKIAQFEDVQRGYGSRTAPQFAQRSVSDYDHLARVREWSVAEEDE